MLGEVERLRELLSKATPGEWRQDRSSADVRAPTGDVAVAICQEMENLDLSDKATIAEQSRVFADFNAAAITAAVNFLRSAAFEEMVRDAGRWQRLKADCDASPCAYPCLRDDLADWIGDDEKRTAMSAEGAGNG